MTRLAKPLPRKVNVAPRPEVPKEDSDELKALRQIDETLKGLPKPPEPKDVKFPEVQKVEVINQPEPQEIKIPEMPKEIKISNLDEIKMPEPPLVQKVEVINKEGESGEDEATRSEQLKTIEELKTIVELLDRLKFNRKGELKTDAGGGGTGGNFLGGILTALESTLTVAPDPPSGNGSGQKNVSVAGTAVAIASSTACVSVTIKAKRGNTGNIYIGDSTVDSSNGFILERGASVSLNIDNLSKVFIDADTNGDGVSFFYLTQ